MLDHSVLIYSCNHAPFIVECVESVLRQTERPAEISVYDDGSSDGTCEILRGYGDRVRLIEGASQQTSKFVAEANALQAAFTASRGRIIFLLEGADRFKPDKIERYVAAFDNHPDASLVQAPLDRIDVRGAALGINLEPRKHVANHLREIYRQHDVNFFYPTSALAFSRYYIQRVLPLQVDDGLPVWTDARLCIPAAYYGRIVTLPDPLTDWRCESALGVTRIGTRRIQIEQTLLRARIFNEFCRRHGLRTISPWRNPRFYAQLALHAMPPRIAAFVLNRVRGTSQLAK
jgi:glycosyltransferase involved in cell wall biosynthesis